MYFITSLFMLIIVLISVAFYTVFERKILSYMQVRKGPNKVGLVGLLQPFSDGMKLFLKEGCWPINSNLILYYICPFFGLFQSLFMWVMFPYWFNVINFNFGLLFFLCCLSLGIYSLVLCGWSSNSTYSMLGCIRSISQAISYEISLSLILLCYFILIDSYNLMDFYFIQFNCWLVFFTFPIFFCWFSCCLAECNRSPFDFSEGESELVSGFNVEYSSAGFSLIFIAEYSNMIFMSMITCMIFFGGNFFSFFFFIKFVMLCFLFVWIRCSFPRYRYDKLMYLAWKCYLPLSLNYLLFFIFMKLLVFYHFFLLS